MIIIIMRYQEKKKQKSFGQTYGVKMEHIMKMPSDFKTSMNGKPKQEEFIINSGKVQNVLSKIPNWKAPGLDGVQGFWLKTSSPCINGS